MLTPLRRRRRLLSRKKSSLRMEREALRGTTGRGTREMVRGRLMDLCFVTTQETFSAANTEIGYSRWLSRQLVGLVERRADGYELIHKAEESACCDYCSMTRATRGAINSLTAALWLLTHSRASTHLHAIAFLNT